MASWINIILDTTPPIVNLLIPNTVTNQASQTVTVRSNEPLDNYNEIYLIDSIGTRHNLTFTLQTDRLSYVGEIPFNTMPLGTATFYVRLQDEVLNRTTLLTKTINIVDFIPPQEDRVLNMILEEKAREQIILDKSRQIIITEMT